MILISQLTAVIVDCWILPVSVIRTRSMYTIFVVIATIVIAAGLDCVVFLRPRQHSIGYMGDGFYRSKDPTNSIKVLKEILQFRQIKQQQNTHVDRQ